MFCLWDTQLHRQGVWWTPVTKEDSSKENKHGTSFPAKDKWRPGHDTPFGTGKCPVESVGLCAQPSCKLLQDWDITYFRIFVHYIMSLNIFFHAENGPVHIWNISKIRSWIQHKSFLVYLVRQTKYMCVYIYMYDLHIFVCQIYLAYLAASSSNHPSKPVFGTGFFSAAVCVLFVSFSNTRTQFLLTFTSRDSIPHFSKSLLRISSHIF